MSEFLLLLGHFFQVIWFFFVIHRKFLYRPSLIEGNTAGIDVITSVLPWNKVVLNPLYSSCIYPQFVIIKTCRLKTVEYGFQPTKDAIRSIMISNDTAPTPSIVG